MNNIKQIIIIVLVSITIAIAYVLPKQKYYAIDILNHLDIPLEIGEWTGKDVSSELDLNDDRYKFISDIFARTYTRPDGANLLFLMVNVDNFHLPKACFTSSGFSIRELIDTIFAVDEFEATIKVKTIFARKGRESYVIAYWININGRLEPNWVGGEAKQLFANILNKKRAGLMIRLDIPTAEYATKESLLVAQDFIKSLASNLTPEQLKYILGT